MRLAWRSSHQRRTTSGTAGMGSHTGPARSPGRKKRVGTWLLQIGDYRVIYDVDDEAQLVTVYKIGHRRDVYRELLV